MPTFNDLYIGDMFNTKVARYVKVTNSSAIVVGGTLMELGCIRVIDAETEVIILYSGNPRLKG